MNLHKKALLLSYFTVGYNMLEGIVPVVAGGYAGSAALIGFGLDSFIESLSGSIMIWRFSKGNSLSHQEEERIEKKTITLVSYAFFILGAYVLYDSLKTLYFQEKPETSLTGILISIASIIVMPTLFYIKYKTGKSVQSRSLVADSKQTLACVMMSACLLVGLSMHYLFDIWQADSFTGIIIAFFLLREGYKTYKEKQLCDC